jgi:hypothetical protein
MSQPARHLLLRGGRKRNYRLLKKSCCETWIHAERKHRAAWANSTTRSTDPTLLHRRRVLYGMHTFLDVSFLVPRLRRCSLHITGKARQALSFFV